MNKKTQAKIEKLEKHIQESTLESERSRENALELAHVISGLQEAANEKDIKTNALQEQVKTAEATIIEQRVCLQDHK